MPQHSFCKKETVYSAELRLNQPFCAFLRRSQNSIQVLKQKSSPNRGAAKT
jgi:hypothetical protein